MCSLYGEHTDTCLAPRSRSCACYLGLAQAATALIANDTLLCRWTIHFRTPVVFFKWCFTLLDLYYISVLSFKVCSRVWYNLSCGIVVIYTTPSPSPARSHGQTKHEVQECFKAMAQTQAFRNIAGRVYTGHIAYSDVPICHKFGERRRIQDALKHPERESDTVEDGANECGETLRSALAGLCLFNHIALT